MFKFVRTMHLKLPSILKGRTVLERDLFNQTVLVPSINVPNESIQATKWKKSLLNLCSFKNIRDLQPISKTHKQVLFDPDIIKTKEDLIEAIPSISKYAEESFDFTSVDITYANYSIEDVVKAILPDELGKDRLINTGSGYSLIGHIAHFNLKDEVLPYKNVIGEFEKPSEKKERKQDLINILAQVVLDKLPAVKTVVNKLHEIDSVYRNFELEILAGEPNTIVQCRESKATFQFDFAKVYWNPRLSMFIDSHFLLFILFQLGTERERIVGILHHNDLVFDVFAGVGPFVVPALMLGCTVYANDINPESVKWMKINLKTNQSKKAPREYQVHNLDGREFLRTIALPRIESYQTEILNDKEKQWCLTENKIVVLMNLPDIALTFLDVISEWLTKDIESRQQWLMPIHIYCYTFSKGENREEDIRSRLKAILPNVNEDQISCRFVRQVAPNKDMLCVRITLFDKNPKAIEDERDNRPAKKFKVDPSSTTN